MPRLSRIAIYPLKSFAPRIVEAASVLRNGALQHDRQFALADASGRFINAKRTAVVHTLQIDLDPITRTLTACRRPHGEVGHWKIDTQREEIERWLSQEFGCEVFLLEQTDGGFPDDELAPGPTIISTATLEVVASWFPGLTLEDVRLRFRANLEVGGTEPFWEDHLFGEASSDRPFRIGGVVFGGSNPCQRCVVPSRDPATGDVYPEFTTLFAHRRELQLPVWAARQHFNHFYRLAVNTRLIDPGAELLRVGDVVELQH